MKISEICEGERPREKIIREGAGSLSNAELLAVLIRVGTRGEGAVDIGHRILAAAGGNLVRLSEMSASQICAVKGIREGKAAAILAALELGRRFLSESSYLKDRPVTCASDVCRMMLPRLKGLDHEECWVIFLNNARFPVGMTMTARGGLSSTTIDIREIVKIALAKNAQAMILVHNHPSGSPLPGTADLKQTEALKKAAESMDLVLLDHVIICNDSFYSFADEEVVRSPF